MIIRHAEKPDGVSQGVTELGAECKHDLTVRGWERAGALGYFFTSGTVPKPQFLFASAPTDGGEEENGLTSRSRRSVDTLLPLSRRLHLHLNTAFTKGQELQMVEAVQKCDGVVLIAWQHEAIDSIVRALAGSHAQVPSHWPEVRFDIIYLLNYDATTGLYQFEQQPQCLLDGDTASVIR